MQRILVLIAAVLLGNVSAPARADGPAASPVDNAFEQIIEKRCPSVLAVNVARRQRMEAKEINAHFYYRNMIFSIRDAQCPLMDHVLESVDEMLKVVTIRGQGDVPDAAFLKKEREIKQLALDEDARRSKLQAAQPSLSNAELIADSLLRKYQYELTERLLDEPLPRQATYCTYFGRDLGCIR